MHAQERANTVSRAVVVVQPFLPEKLPGKDIKLNTRCTSWEYRTSERDVTFQDKGVHFPVLSCGFPNDHSASDIGGAVRILPTGVHEIEVVHLQHGRCAIHMIVMTKRAIFTGG